MRIRSFLPLAALAMLAACGDDETPKVPAGTEIAANGVAVAPPASATGGAAAPTATGAGTAFGLTTEQLEDADLVDGAGATLGEVERVETDAQGNVNALVIETDGTDRRVRIPLTGLSAVADGDDWNLRAADMTRERLRTLPIAE